MNKLARFTIVVLAAGSLAACGGGGGGDTVASQPTDPDTVFTLFSDEVLTSGYSGSFEITGSDNVGGVYTGSFRFTTGPLTTYRDRLVVPVEQTFSLRETGSGAFVSVTGTEYYSAEIDDFRILGYTDKTQAIVTVAATTYSVPKTARIGDFGDVGRYTNSVSETLAVSWRLDDAGDGKATLVVMTSTFDQSGTLSVVSQTSWLIDTSGQRQAVEFDIYYFDTDISLQLYGVEQ